MLYTRLLYEIRILNLLFSFDQLFSDLPISGTSLAFPTGIDSTLSNGAQGPDPSFRDSTPTNGRDDPPDSRLPNGGGQVQSISTDQSLLMGSNEFEAEWIEQYEPDVYITLVALRDGTRDLKRVRFSRRRFTEQQAETWWSENRENVYEKYNILGSKRATSSSSQLATMGGWEVPFLIHFATSTTGFLSYADPEHYPQKVSEKSDVFHMAKPHIQYALRSGDYTNLVDSKLLQMNYNEKEMKAMISCAAACIYKPSNSRPKMNQIVRALEGYMRIEEIWNEKNDNVFLKGEDVAESSDDLIRLARTLDDLENKLAKGENELAKGKKFSVVAYVSALEGQIFLDDDFELRVAEYGREKFSSDFEVIRNSARCMAPEYAITSKFTKKTIVYSYGVMLLEMITGKEAFDDIVEWGVPQLERALSNVNYDFVDKRLKEYNKNEMNRMIACALACLRDNPQDRPEMRQIVEVLKGNIDMHDLLKREQQLTKQVELTFGMESLPSPRLWQVEIGLKRTLSRRCL
ncbi:hypothetical protein GH714_009384 [Hevea brasiliensis]|uniref:non-specific serine/threonine protein kinase n=1 Tax=Hevea brasiliensis TaxID=3981 RepID=A0A6A6L0G4_HEVBR|nr:hypothetical protein GH714_009384 [Hevea brasiliensis]